MQKQATDLAKANRQLKKAKKDGYRIIYIDETMFTRANIPKSEWSLPKQNFSAPFSRLDEPTLAVLAGISQENGMEHFMIFDRSVNVVKFKEYIRELRAANGDDKICIFMDNLSSHTSKKS